MEIAILITIIFAFAIFSIPIVILAYITLLFIAKLSNQSVGELWKKRDIDYKKVKEPEWMMGPKKHLFTIGQLLLLLTTGVYGFWFILYFIYKSKEEYYMMRVLNNQAKTITIIYGVMIVSMIVGLLYVKSISS